MQFLLLSNVFLLVSKLRFYILHYAIYAGILIKLYKLNNVKDTVVNLKNTFIWMLCI